jgi:uracil-DNA glycosylase family 4
MIIGEAPTNYKSELTKPFPGNAGRLLDRILMENGVSRDTLYLTHLIHCSAPENESPTQAEIKACKVHLQREIDEVKPKFIIVMGAVALKGVLGKGASGIMDIHGVPIEKEGITYLPAFHPAAALRDPKKEAPLKSDMKKFFEIINGTWKPSTGLNLTIIRNVEQFKEMLHDLKDCPVIGFDLETTCLDPREEGADINCLGISRYADNELTQERQWVLPMSGENLIFKTKGGMKEGLQEILLMMKGKKIVTQNGKFDNRWLRVHYDIRFPITFDTMMAAHILNENEPCGLKYLAKVHLNAPAYDISSEDKRGQGPDLEKMYEYCGYDVLYTLRLYKMQRGQLMKNADLLKLFKFLIMPAFEAFEDIECHGVFVHKERLAALEIVLKAELAEVHDKLEAMAPGVNWNSPKQVGKILFEDWKLVPLELTKSGAPSTAEGILQRLKGQHEGIDLLLKHRELAKQVSSFIEGWKKFLGPHERLHPNFKLHGTVTGRLCLREGTEVMIPGGTRPIQDIKTGDLVYSFDDELKLTLKKVKSSGLTGSKPCYRVHWVGQGGHTEGFLDATGNHPIRLTSGSYIKVEDLAGGKYIKWRKRYHHGEHVMALHRSRGDYNYLHFTGETVSKTKEARVVYGRTRTLAKLPDNAKPKPQNHMITYVEKLPGIFPVYDIEVEDTHNFIANELCVHNSCSDPNLQQVPRDKKIRTLIGAPPGWRLLECDYSQVELRIAAMVSGDPTMIGIFNDPKGDIHRKTASLITGKPPELITKDERKKAKACFSGDTEILTKAGWVRFDKYNGTDEVAQYFQETQEISFTKPIAFQSQNNRELYSFIDRNNDLLVTADHEILYFNRNTERVEKRRADSVPQNTYLFSAGLLKRTEYKLTETETRILAMIAADGSFKDHTRLRFGFKKQHKIDRCKQLLDAYGVSYTRRTRADGATIFEMNSPKIMGMIKPYLDDNKNLSWSCLTDIPAIVYLDEAAYWDSWSSEKFAQKYTKFTTHVRQSADIMQAMACTSGTRAVLYVMPPRDKKRTEGYKITYRPGGRLDSRTHLSFQKIPGSHMAYCVQVQAENIVIRRDNKVGIQGNCNFGFLYGMREKKFQEYARDKYETDLTIEEATAFRQRFFETYSELPKWHQRQKVMVRQYGQVKCLDGRIRHLPEIMSPDEGVRAQAERNSINAPVQGFASDMTMMAVVALSTTYGKDVLNIVGTIHDAILMEIRDDIADKLLPEIKKLIECPPLLAKLGVNLTVPIVTDTHFGDWGSE